jgi:predicted esterase YcpF (UPF0227 family)
MLYYIHGYLSSPNSAKGTLFRDKLGAKAIQYRDCKPEDLIVADCLEEIIKEIANDTNAFLIGSSFGGFLAAKVALEKDQVTKLILLNPSIIPPSVDISSLSGLPSSILYEMKDEHLFENKIDAEITILRGTKDDVVPSRWVLEFAKSQEATVKFFNDDHQFSKYLEKLPDIISNIINVEKNARVVQ